MTNRPPRPFSASWWGSSPGPWLSLLVPAVVLALILVWATYTPGEVLRIPEDYSVGAAQYWLRQADPPIKGQVQSGILDMETQELTVEVMVAPGKFETVKFKIVGKGKNPRAKK